MVASSVLGFPRIGMLFFLQAHTFTPSASDIDGRRDFKDPTVK